MLVSRISTEECSPSILTDDDIQNNSSSCLSHKDTIEITVTLRTEDIVPHTPCVSLRVTMILFPSYPESESPGITLSCPVLTREYTQVLEQEVKRYSQTIQSTHSHCLFNILDRIKDSLRSLQPRDFKDGGLSSENRKYEGCVSSCPPQRVWCNHYYTGIGR